MGVRELPNRRRRDDGFEKYQGRYFWLFLAAVVGLGIIGVRLWQLQIIDGDEYYRASTENIIREISVDPPRGQIFDRQGVSLAENRPSYDVYVDPQIMASAGDEEVYELLKDYLHLSDEELRELRSRLDDAEHRVRVRGDISHRDLARLQENQMRLPGVEIEVQQQRHYPLHRIGAHTLGYVSQIGGERLEELRNYGYRGGDIVGRRGLENSYEELLHGSPGIDREVVDAQGNPVGEARREFLIGEYQAVQPVPGRDLVTTLDAGLMVVMDEAMEDYEAGAAVAIDPSDGSVLGMYSKPNFNPNAWSGRLSAMEKSRSDRDPFRPMVDKTVSGYFPGSVFKVVGAWMALEESGYAPGRQHFCPGHFDLGSHRFRCWRDRGHGDVDAYTALQQSCDVYFYEVANELGIDPLARYARRFGFGERTGIELSHESPGRVPDEQWHEERSPDGYQRGFALNTIIGQGDLLATPLQVAMAYAAIANGGDLYYPRLVDEVRNPDGELLFEFTPRVREQMGIDEEHLAVLQEGLRRVVEEPEGTASHTALRHTEVAGKTGTAQVAEIGAIRLSHEERQWRRRNHAWFAAYAPIDDPEIALVVFLQHGGGGGGDAAPVAMEILERYLTGQSEVALQRRLGSMSTGGSDR